MRGRWWPWLLLVLALVPASLISKPKQSIQMAPADSVTEAIFHNPATLDPALASSGSEWAVASNVFEPLFRLEPDGQVLPNLVSHDTINGNVLTLDIRPVAMVGGGHLTASIVAAALARPLWPSVHSAVAAQLLAPVQGSTAVIKGKTPFLSGVSLVNSQTVAIHLTHPVTTAFVQALANPALAIVPASDLLRGGSDWQLTNLFGTGGYRISNWVPNGMLTFRRESGRGPTRISLVVVPSFQQAVLSVQNQAVQLVPVQPDQVGSIPQKLLADVRSLPVPGNLNLIYRAGAKNVSTYPRISVSDWVRASFRGRIAGLQGNWPAALPGGRPMTVYVNQAMPEAVQLAQTLARLKPHQVTVRVVSLTQLETLAKNGQIGAYIGQVDWFKRGVSMPLAPLRSLWLVSPSIAHVAVYANGAADWHSLTLRP